MTTEQKNSKQKERPLHIRVGSVSATVWKNGTNGQRYYSVTIDRAYRDRKTGRWDRTRSLRANDIPKAILALQKAYEYIAVRGGCGFELDL